jgi:hypothetical protein
VDLEVPCSNQGGGTNYTNDLNRFVTLAASQGIDWEAHGKHQRSFRPPVVGAPADPPIVSGPAPQSQRSNRPRRRVRTNPAQAKKRHTCPGAGVRRPKGADSPLGNRGVTFTARCRARARTRPGHRSGTCRANAARTLTTQSPNSGSEACLPLPKDCFRVHSKTASYFGNRTIVRPDENTANGPRVGVASTPRIRRTL